MSVLIFDMDGVLVDVSDSYRATIAATVRHFTGREISRELIQEYKNAGGWNNDWGLSRKLISDVGQLDVPEDEVVAIFQEHFLGRNNDGLIRHERWLPEVGLLERLAVKHQLAIFTGRPRAEVNITLSRFSPDVPWQTIIADGDVANAKPAPDGLLAIASAHGHTVTAYVGDTVDDARSARIAGVRFIGVSSSRELLQAEGAAAVIENINEIEKVL